MTNTPKSDSLMFRGHITTEVVNKMTEVRKAVIVLSRMIEGLGSSRESEIAFTHLETALHYAIKHLVLTDTQATIEDPFVEKREATINNIGN